MSRKKEILNLTGSQKLAIEAYVFLCAKFEKCFFWEPTHMNVSSRRNYEKSNTFTFKDEVFELSFELNVSCRHYYVYKTCLVNGISHNCKYLKNLIK